MIECDYLIVGGGTAGCVLANRLSAGGQHRVVLIEAGRDQKPDRVEPDVLDSYPRVAYFNPKNLWADLRVFFEPPAASRGNAQQRRYEQARIIGGGSSINDMQANRGIPADYDEWASLGAKGWGWSEVLPYFRRLERDMDFDGPLHGKEGPIPIRRIMSDAWPVFSRAAAEAFRHAGYKELQDQNAQFDDGFFPCAISNLYDRRVSTAIGYLDNAARGRSNLTILPNSVVRELTREGHRFGGALVDTPDGALRVQARETVVSAGALHSPAILMRAGIGPPAELHRHGIEVVSARAGVGKNLHEHPALSVSAWIKPEARLGDILRRHIHVALRYSSNVENCPRSDMYTIVVSKTGWHPVGKQIGSFVTFINKPYSRGSVTLQSARPGDEPHVEFAMLSDSRDLARLKACIIRTARLFDAPSMQAAMADPFPSSYSERVRDLGIINRKNHFLTGVLATLLDGPAWLRRTLIKQVVTEGASLEQILKDDEVLEAFVRNTAFGVWHASGTCRMGQESDADAVVSANGEVFGVEGLRVVDASVMPAVPRANTNIPTIMIAEKISDQMLNMRTH